MRSATFVDILIVPPLKGLKFEDGAYPALRLPRFVKSGEPGTPLRAGLSCRRPALRDLIAGISNLFATRAFKRNAGMSTEPDGFWPLYWFCNSTMATSSW